MKLRTLRIIALFTAPCLATAACGGDAPETPRSAVLITLDTTRRDALGCYGAPAAITPHLDALAADSLVFDAARTVAPITLPAHSSMLTGLYPPRHGVRDNGLVPLPESASTLAERASVAGFQTAAFVSAIVLGAEYGVDQGFDLYDQPVGAAQGGHGAERPGAETVAAATRWLAERDPDRPFFLWVHLFDAHGPNEPPKSHLDRAGGDPYLGDVAVQDDAVGVLLDALRDDPAWDETLIVVVGDHGEALGEHGEETHTTFVYDSTLAVPLLLHGPGIRPGRSDAVTSVVDVFPTLIEALALGGPGSIDGQSLFNRTIEPDRGVYFESYHGLLYFGWSTLAGWADAEAKYVHSSAPELYAIADDPKELANVIAKHEARVEPYRSALERIAAQPSLEHDEEVLDRAILPALEDLGYAGSSSTRDVPDPLDAGDGPSPHSRADELRGVMVARFYGTRGMFEEAVAELDAVLARDPRNHEAWNRKGAYLMNLGRFDEAIEALERFVAIGPDWPNVWLNLARSYKASKQPAKAEEWARKLVEREPDDPGALRLLVDALLEQGRIDEAAPYQLKLIELQ